MPDSITGFIKITQVGREYRTSRSTVERRRDAARDAAEDSTYRMFRLRTKDGEVFTEPSKDEVARLTREGRVPEWFVARAWLEKQFGKRSDQAARQPSDQPSQLAGAEIAQVVATLRTQYEQRIDDLKQQLAAEKQEKKELLQYAQADKQLFARAAESLTQVLALPGITAATKAQSSGAIPGTAVATQVPAAEPVEKSKISADEQSAVRSTSPSNDKPGLWQRIIGNRHAA